MLVRTRFAPSPTGNIHLGNIRTALFSWLYARSQKGQFILRIEDTDQERSTLDAKQTILASMAWLNLDYDEGPYYQSSRLEHYRQLALQLVAKGLAYPCYCTKERLDKLRKQQLANKEKPRYDGCCRDQNLPIDQNQPHVIRFKNPQAGKVEFVDQVLGPLSFQNSELDDLVIIRSDNYPAYNFCVVADDLEMDITHVIRGSDHINNTPRQINIFRAFNARPPYYAHVPLILGHDGKLLSKRHAATSVLQYKEAGFLPEALLNYLVRLGWSYKDQELFKPAELIQLFDIKDINRAAATFSAEKLLWFNRYYLKNLELKTVASRLEPFLRRLYLEPKDGPPLEEVVLALRERAETLVDLAEKSGCFYRDIEQYGEIASYFPATVIPAIQAFKDSLLELKPWTDEKLHQQLIEISQKFELKLGKIAQPIRIAVTGSAASPPINTTLRLMGRERSIKKIEAALNYLTPKP